jgi:hypothetical protein
MARYTNEGIHRQGGLPSTPELRVCTGPFLHFGDQCTAAPASCQPFRRPGAPIPPAPSAAGVLETSSQRWTEAVRSAALPARARKDHVLEENRVGAPGLRRLRSVVSARSFDVARSGSNLRVSSGRPASWFLPPNRGARIRTGDLLLPKQARYRAAPRPATGEDIRNGDPWVLPLLAGALGAIT